MKPTALVLAAASVLAGCGDNVEQLTNPSRLWMALRGRETEIQLVPVEPPYF